MTYEVLLFYKYVTIADPEVVAQRVQECATRLGLLGRVIVAQEGINATLEGRLSDTTLFLKDFLTDERFKGIDIKRSAGDGRTFPKLSVKVRTEIVGTRFTSEEADPRVKTAPRVGPDEIKKWYEANEDFVVIDMRNSYEFSSGHFVNAIDPGLRNSRDLPQAMERLVPFKEKKVLTVCTGGVRCEKMSAYLLNKGFREVYQLDGGIHSYMEKYPGQDFLGTLYTFDQRVTMDFGGERKVIGRCALCGTATERYVNCADDDCHLHFLACKACSPEDTSVGCGAECQARIARRAAA